MEVHGRLCIEHGLEGLLMKFVNEGVFHASANMRCRQDGSHTGPSSVLDHRKRHFERSRSIVDARNDMTMDINHRRKVVECMLQKEALQKMFLSDEPN